jgi:hypothetical protein
MTNAIENHTGYYVLYSDDAESGKFYFDITERAEAVALVAEFRADGTDAFMVRDFG